ncbi:MAG: hypothetical protein AMJ43_01940 [Coxiella sp. DG_40]|nr:MAG: hypothetical protein AMJ43_01940 [Coxiella sp. DG_40]
MLIGSVAGVLSGLLGIGGGIIVIPLLIWLFRIQNIPPDLVMHLAAGTSLSVMTFTAASSLYGHIKHGITIWPIYRRLAMGMIIGTIFGAIFGHFLPGRVLEIIFAIFVLLVAFRMLIAIKTTSNRTLPRPLGTFIVALLIGGKSGLLGIGGGAITIPFLSYCNVPIRNIVAVSASCSLTIATIGTISFILTGQHAIDLPTWSLGYIYLPAFLGIVLTSPLCAQLGAYFSHKLPVTVLTRILGAILLIMAIHMLI